jgi:hypothetical protein
MKWVLESGLRREWFMPYHFLKSQMENQKAGYRSFPGTPEGPEPDPITYIVYDIPNPEWGF